LGALLAHDGLAIYGIGVYEFASHTRFGWRLCRVSYFMKWSAVASPRRNFLRMQSKSVMAILLLADRLMVFVFYNDIAKLVTGG
jgi:hypothetical protein